MITDSAVRILCPIRMDADKFSINGIIVVACTHLRFLNAEIVFHSSFLSRCVADALFESSTHKAAESGPRTSFTLFTDSSSSRFLGMLGSLMEREKEIERKR
jgi:hypothetical protein